MKIISKISGIVETVSVIIEDNIEYKCITLNTDNNFYKIRLPATTGLEPEKLIVGMTDPGDAVEFMHCNKVVEYTDFINHTLINRLALK